MMPFKLLMSVILVSLIVLSSGCARLTIHPITDQDIYFLENGNVCFSPEYMKTVLKAKVR